MSSVLPGALRISHRVFLLALVALMGLAVVVGTFLFQRHLEAGYKASATAVAERQAAVSALATDLQQAQLHQKDFLLGKQMGAVEHFDDVVADAASRLETLRANASAETAAKLEGLATALEAYAQSVKSLVAKNTELGLEASTGLAGAMRGAVHSIETLVSGLENAEIRASMLMMRRHEKDFILRRDASYVEKHRGEVETFKVLVKKEFRPGAERQRIMDALDVYTASFRLYAEAAIQEQQLRSTTEQAYEAMQPFVQDVLSYYDSALTQNATANAAAEQWTIRMVIGFVVLTVFSLVISVYLIGRSISRPVAAMTGAMRSLADGKTALTVPGLSRRDEFGAMAQALEIFRQAAIAKDKLEAEATEARSRSEAERERLQTQAQEQARALMMEATEGFAGALKRLASGDLSFQLTAPFSPDFEALRHDLNRTLQQLNEAMGGIAESGYSIDGGAREISQSTDDLARRTEQQAASLEQTAAALDELTANVRLSAERASQARDLATRAGSDAEQTTALLDDTIAAVARIERSSEKIGSIITVIDEIAFQTNLLALNAGVEAARAGEAGRGFAVVAQEVRELAQRSAKAAGEIKALINVSGAEVKEGGRFVRETGNALSRIGGSMVDIREHVNAIAAASREQAIGLGEVNSAINILDQATQSNAAMVEENNAASAVLSREVARLSELLQMFRLNSQASASGDYHDARHAA
ncbi:HAMP domain-containing methyl-accepting chemotaxis protein [Agrobacterium sp. BA1120]|uniref:methyl-accepting chemotaxis protein n=1 Tax=Agrobacterium sp. BA1120 TaxID=3228927 RepID=UPI00336ABFBC